MSLDQSEGGRRRWGIEVEDIGNQIRLYKKRRKIKSQVQLARELGVDPGFISRILNQPKTTPLGYHRAKLLFEKLGLTPMPTLVTGDTRAAEPERWMRDLSRCCSQYTEKERQLLLKLLQLLCGIKRISPPGSDVTVEQLLGSFGEVVLGAQTGTQERLASAMEFADDWFVLGLLVENHICKEKGYFRKKSAANALARLCLRGKRPFFVDLLAQYFHLHTGSATSNVEHEEHLCQRKEIEEFLVQTGGHYTAYRLLSKQLRHAGEFEKARAAAEESLRLLKDLDESRRTHLDDLEEFKAYRDLLSACRNEIRSLVRLDPCEHRKRLRILFEKADETMNTARDLLKQLGTVYERDHPEEEARMTIEQALLDDCRYEAGIGHIHVSDVLERLKLARVQSEAVSATFGVIRANIELYRIHMREKKYPAALQALGNILVHEQDLTRKAKTWVADVNSRYLKAYKDPRQAMIAKLCETLLDKSCQP